ncbi:MAG: DcaP family trimeric outer membrane transporter [Parvularcula sp.]|jgi:hypothetical protein|nr:DcaP family trimeric outer membrane transporter [Parvularcula sp.]
MMAVARNVAAKVALLTAVSAATLGQALAQDQDLEARVDALEAKLDRILERLESPQHTLTVEETQQVRDAVQLIKTSAVQPEVGFGEVPPEVVLKERPEGFRAGSTDVLFGGYVKVDAAVTEFTGGEVPTNALGRDFYIPSLVPVGGEGSDPVFDFNPRETRFFFGMKSNVNGHDIGGKIEFDFLVTNQPFEDERVSNSYLPRMRHAFVTIDNWLLGQTWSTFQDVAALPDNLDFIGPSEGTVFNRQPMIRYTRGGLQVALEQPETLITTGTGGRASPEGQDTLPDLVLRYNARGDYGHLTVASILRQLKATDSLTGTDDETALGWGISGSGLLKLSKSDQLRFMATYGDGVGRYIGVNIVNDAALNPDGALETIQTASGFVSLQHRWSPSWRSNLTYGYFNADNPVTLTSGAVTDTVSSVHANLIYSLTPTIDLGMELIRADRELENGADGAMNKLQFSAKYGF